MFQASMRTSARKSIHTHSTSCTNLDKNSKGSRRTADSGGPLMALPSLLKGLPDMERGITRIFHRTANPAEFVQVLQALVNIAPKLGVQVSCMLPTYGHVQHCQATSRPEPRPNSNCKGQACHGLLQICSLRHVHSQGHQNVVCIHKVMARCSKIECQLC